MNKALKFHITRLFVEEWSNFPQVKGYAKNGRLIPDGEERKRNKTSVKLRQAQYICPIKNKPSTGRRRFVFQTEISDKYIVPVLMSLLFYFF